MSMLEPSLGWAQAADDSDPLKDLRERFHIPPSAAGDGPSIYLVGNSLGCMPKGVEAEMAREFDNWKTLGVEAHLQGDSPWYPYHESLREPGARLVGALPHEVVFMNSLTVNLHLMMVSFYRPTAERHKIVIEESAFPSDRYAVASQIEFHGFDPKTSLVQLKPREGERVLHDEDIIEFLKANASDVALVMLPGVNYLSGQVFDMQAITAAARQAGCAVGWDLAHAAGNIPLKLHEWGPDFACWCSYKYLNSGPGAIAGCFVHERHTREGSGSNFPRFAGWWGNDPNTRFEMGEQFVPVASADAWQLSNPPIFSMTPLRVSLELFDRATMDALRAKALRLSEYTQVLLEARLGDRIQIITPSEPERRGCQLSILVPGQSRPIHDALGKMGIVTDFRAPDVIRTAPVPLYNTFADVYGFVEGLERALSAGD